MLLLMLLLLCAGLAFGASTGQQRWKVCCGDTSQEGLPAVAEKSGKSCFERRFTACC